jgi:hypothetical protein
LLKFLAGASPKTSESLYGTIIVLSGRVLGPFDSKGFPNFPRKVTRNNKTAVPVNLSTKVEVVFYKFVQKIPIYVAQDSTDR